MGRATPDDVKSIEARRLMGLDLFTVPVNATAGEAKVINQANAQFSP